MSFIFMFIDTRQQPVYTLFIVDCPLWDNYMWDDVEGKPENLKEMILKPVAMFENPFFRSPHKIVLCEFWLNMETPSSKPL